MKIWHVTSGAALAIALAGCAGNGKDVPTATLGSQGEGQVSTLAQPSVSGNVWIRQRMALPPDSVVTITLSDASLADAPSKVLSQRVFRTEGKQAPFHFTLPFNPSDIQPNANILLSAAITINGKLAFVTDTVQSVINKGGTKKDLTLVQVPSVAIPMQSGTTSTVPGDR